MVPAVFLQWLTKVKSLVSNTVNTNQYQHFLSTGRVCSTRAEEEGAVSTVSTVQLTFYCFNLSFPKFSNLFKPRKCGSIVIRLILNLIFFPLILNPLNFIILVKHLRWRRKISKNLDRLLYKSSILRYPSFSQ